MPTDTVTFRRLVGAKKDKFFCNGKELPNAKQFLDVAGLTNTFVVVKQGKVNQLAQGTDKFRFNLLETIAGSAFYDEKMQHAAKVLKSMLFYLFMSKKLLLF
jgi:chromosome segregation ATPase